MTTVKTKEFYSPTQDLNNYLMRRNLTKMAKAAPVFLTIGFLGLTLPAFKFFFVGFLATPLIIIGSLVDLWRELRAAKKLAETKFQYEFSDNNFAILSGNKTSLRMEDFMKVIKDAKSRLYLLYPSESNINFFVLPFDAFRSPIEQETFEGFLNKKRLLKK